MLLYCVIRTAAVDVAVCVEACLYGTFPRDTLVCTMSNHAAMQADLTDDADKIFLLLKSEGIGTQLALFWAAWAYVLEMAASYSRAAEVITEGRAR